MPFRVSDRSGMFVFLFDAFAAGDVSSESLDGSLTWGSQREVFFGDAEQRRVHTPE